MKMGKKRFREIEDHVIVLLANIHFSNVMKLTSCKKRSRIGGGFLNAEPQLFVKSAHCRSKKQGNSR